MRLARFSKRGQTTVEYVLLLAGVALPTSLMFFKWTQRFFAGLIVNIVNGFTGNWGP